MTNPYAEHAFDYKAKGYSPLPLPERRKKPVPDGYTGTEGVIASGPDIQEWIDKGRDYNIAIRMPHGVIGIDVDDYDDKTGGQTMRQAVEMFGRLPVIGRLTSRYGDDPVSGIRLFRVPTDAVLVAQLSSAGLGPHVEILQFHHRYAVAPGSIHPDTGATYEWVLADGTFGELPAVADLPELPEAWLAALTPKRAEMPTSEASHAAYDAMDDAKQAKVRTYVDKAIGAIYAELDAMKAWGDSYRNERGEGWEEGVLQRTLRLAQFVKADWNPLTVDQVLRSLKKCLPTDSGFSLESSLGKFLRALNNDAIAGAWYPLDDEDDWTAGIRYEPGKGKAAAEPAEDPADEDDVELLGTRHKPFIKFGIGNLVSPDEKVAPPGKTARKIARLWPMAKMPLSTGRAWWIYRDGVWTAANDFVEDSLAASYDDVLHKINTKHVEAILSTITDEITIEALEDFINLRNGMLEWRTGQLHEHGASYLTTVQIPHAWNPDAECPTFDAWLAERLSPESVKLAWELIAISLYSGNPIQRAGLLYGVGKSGKSTFLEVIMGLIGEHNYSSLSPQDMSKTVFATHLLLGKQCNIATDIDPTKVTETAIFKRVVASEPIPAQQKNKPEFVFRPFCNHLFSANQVPKTADRTSAWTRRFAILRFETAIDFDGLVIDQYHRILLKEAEGIIAKAVKVLPELIRRREYSIVAEDQAEFERATDFTADFWDEAAVISGDGKHFTASEHIAKAFEIWCARNGHAAKVPIGDLVLRLRDHPKCKSDRGYVGGRQVRGWRGILLAPEYRVDPSEKAWHESI